jgi:hypothetical protein
MNVMKEMLHSKMLTTYSSCSTESFSSGIKYTTNVCLLGDSEGYIKI